MSKMLYGQGGLRQLPTAIEQEAVQAMIEATFVEFLGDVATGSAVLSNVADTSKIKVGDRVYGAKQDTAPMPTVISKTSSTVTLSGSNNTTVVADRMVAVRDSVPLQGCKVMLFTDAIAYPIKPDVLADLTPAAFTGYALSSAVVWGAPFQDLNNNVFVTGDKKQFLCSADSPATPAITGAALVSGDGLTLLGVDIFLGPDGTPAPVAIEEVGDALDYVPTFAFVPVS